MPSNVLASPSRPLRRRMLRDAHDRADTAQSVRAIHAALDAGIRLIDTADTYALDDSEIGHNETLVAKALAGRRERAIIPTKGGKARTGRDWGINGRADHRRTACEASLKRLRADCSDLYQLHAPDPDVPFADSVGRSRSSRTPARSEPVGLSNVASAKLDEALRIVVSEWTSKRGPPLLCETAATDGRLDRPGRQATSTRSRSKTASTARAAPYPINPRTEDPTSQLIAARDSTTFATPITTDSPAPCGYSLSDLTS
jgi:aryl-alcohol dehydrogenase-like predicted oxidoreductase